jgi:hypothetical protein
MEYQIIEYEEIQIASISDDELEGIGLNLNNPCMASDSTSRHPSGTCRQQC